MHTILQGNRLTAGFFISIKYLSIYIVINWMKIRNALHCILIYIFFFTSNGWSQKADTLQLHARCMQFASLSDSILKGSNDSIKTESNRIFTQHMDSAIADPASFNYHFSPLTNLSVLQADNKVKIYTWMLPTARGMHFDFFGYIQVMKDDNSFHIYPLREKKYFNNSEDEFLKLKDSTWYGALYYKVLHKKYKKKDQYILMGWQGKDRFTTRKIIDNLVISPGKIEFGKPVFKAGGKARSRIILEYNSQANVSLNYNDDMNLIVFDHLSSSDPRPEAKGMFNLYGPDMTYDAFKFKDGFWILQKDIEVKNERDVKAGDVKLNRELRMQRK
jgi:hypothetical protein